MTKVRSLAYLLIYLGTLLALKFLVVDRVFSDKSEATEFWFTTGLLLVVLGVFVTEKYFTKSLDVIVNVVTVIVVLLTIDSSDTFKLYEALFLYTGIVGVMALTSFVLYSDNKDPSSSSQRIAGFLNKICTYLGSSKVLFSIIFILSLFNYFIFSLETAQLISKEQLAILLMLIFWGATLLIEPIDTHLIQPIIDWWSEKRVESVIGKISSKFLPSTIYAELYPNVKEPAFGDIFFLSKKKEVEKKDCPVAMYIDSQETQNTRFAQLHLVAGKVENVTEQVFVMPVTDIKDVQDRITNVPIYKSRSDLVGFVSTGSDIDILQIKMLREVDEAKKLQEGDLVSVDFYGSSTKYQIINVKTSDEQIEAKNRLGFKVITAQQIGSWNEKNHKFENSSWVPSVNSPVFQENENLKRPDLKGAFYKIGVVPKSSYPIYLNLDEAVNHHIAIIGKTGTGKSYMSAQIIKKMVANGYKVVLLEIDQNNPQSLSKYIDTSLLSKERVQWSFDTKKKKEGYKEVDYKEWKAKLDLNSQDDKGGKVFVVNWDNDSKKQDDGPLSQTDAAIAIITSVIAHQLKNKGQRVCIVMEEAYDFIPENNFGQHDYGHPNVSRITQMVLKCRKHDVGFFIITQRTALVSKTILNQCHTIVALQSFDETSRTFMSSYISNKYLDSMSILPKFRTVVVGKGSSCDKPIIVDFEDKEMTRKKKQAQKEKLEKQTLYSKLCFLLTKISQDKSD